MIKHTNKIDMVTGGIPVVIHVNQYDSDFSLVFELYSSDGEFTLESGTTVTIRGTKTDGNGYSVDAAIDIPNKKVTVTGDQQMTACAGRNTFELTLSKNNKELNTANFILDVERAALDKDTISNSVIRELINVIDRTDEIIAAARQADAAQESIAQLTQRSETAANDAEGSATAAKEAKQAAEKAYQDLDTVIEEKTEEATDEIDNVYQEHIDDINAKAQQILAIKTEADQTAADALSVANNAENHMATLDSKMKDLETAMQDVSIDPDDLGLYQDEDTMYVYPTYKGVVSENGIPLASKGGGGGGGDVISATFSMENTTGWLSKTIPSGSDCNVSFTWSSIEDEMPTGDGNIRITVNDVVKASYQVQQGAVSVNLAPYLSVGNNKVKVRISDTYDQGKTVTFNISSVVLSINSSFDATQYYNSTISFPYTPVGAVEKTVYFILDGRQIGTQVTSVSGRQMSFVIPAQSHGAHALKVYYEADINGETVRSNELYYEFVSVDPLDNTTIITSSYNTPTQPQYASIAIPYMIYNPAALTADVEIYANQEKVASLTVDRSEQSYTYRANDYGSLTIEIKSRGVTKTINITVEESEIDVEAETQDLALYLTSLGRSNREEHPDTWTYGEGTGQIACSFSDFNWSSDGWQTDTDGITVMRVAGDARITIPYKLFETDFRGTGKTIEFEFATRNVLDYDSPILSCLSDGRGLSLTAQKASLKSEQSEITVQYKEDDHIRVSFVTEKRAEDRLLLVYINGIPSGVVQYPTDDDFAQTTPVNISVGSNDCTIDLYCIRVYDNNLTRHQILENWIADTRDGTQMLDRFTRNNIYDAYGKIVVSSMPASLPYFILDAEELPQYKGDKKTITGSYTDPLYPSRSFTFEGCQINVQGTSSAPYARKNYDMQFKEGFELNSGHAASYALRPGAIPFNRFVLKADVASSEGANNVELVRLYNDSCPYKTPEMVADPRVRWGIDGFPIVVFWHDTVTGDVSFLGKYNFNLPKRAPAPYGYANDDTMESWEFENNTSDLLLFKSDYFDQTPYTDDEGKTWPNWKKDFEARFPSDEWLDTDILQEFVSFVVSTDRNQASGENLPAAVTYDDVEYTTDTADYRLAKFKAEFPTYAELDTFLFYYIFTELFLMVDSRAKNLFIGFNGSDVTAAGRVATRKATAQPYDMDTGLGTNNEGSLVFGYGLEDIDHLTGGADIFNGQNSTLWCNLRDSYSSEITRMYQSLRSAGTISYDSVEARYEEHQSKWPEAVWIEDSWFKYIDPLISPDPGKEATAVYLPMMQGSKEEQRKWWLINRFKYMDSKWNAGEALSQVIQLRGYAKANITVTPYADIYPSVKYGSYMVSERGEKGETTTLICPLDSVNDTEIYIYSAPQLKSVGDLSGLKVGFADFSMATRLQSVKIGDGDSNYDNPNLYSLSLGSNVLLKSIDVRNCSGLGDTSMVGHTQTTVDISGCEIVEEVYFDGTKIQGLTLPNGGVLKKLHLPATMTNLTIVNQKAITEFVIPSFASISTLRLENVSSAVDSKAILNAIPTNSRVRLIGIAWEAEDAEEIKDLLDLLDTMRGLDENGNNVDTAQVSGTIHTGSLTGAEIAEFNHRYPYLRITADYVESTLTYKTYDGTNTIKTVTCLNGTPQEGAPSVPARANSSDGHYSYTGLGWNTEMDSQAADPDAIKDVIADRTVYAAYRWDVRTYTVYWKNSDGTTLETDNNVPWGTTPTYNGSTPQNPTSGGGSFTGWTPAITKVTGNTTYTASYIPVYTVIWYNDDRSTELYRTTVQQGSTATYAGTNPPVSTNGDDYIFLSWDKVTTNVQSNLSVYAQYKAPKKFYPPGFEVTGAYAVQWDYTDPETTLSRGGAAASFADPAPAASISGSGSSPFDNIAPWKDMKRYNVIGTEFVPETDSRFDQAANDTVVYIPEFYYKSEKDTINSRWTWAISPTAKSGYTKHPGSGKYIGRYHTSGSSDGVYSKSGVLPLVNTSQTNFRTYSKNKGTGWYMLDLATWSALQMLYLVEFADFNSQSVLGTGYDTGSLGSAGGTDAAQYHTIKASKAHNQYRWVEDPFSNCFDWIDGFVGSRSATHAAASNSGYSGGQTGLNSLGFALPSSGYITGFGYSEDASWAFIPDAASGGSETTFVADRVSSNTSLCPAYVGGYYLTYASYGMFYFYANNSASNTGGNLGSRLLKEPA